MVSFCQPLTKYCFAFYKDYSWGQKNDIHLKTYWKRKHREDTITFVTKINQSSVQ